MLAAVGGAAAVDNDDDPTVARDPSYVAARQAIRGRQYGDAIRLLTDALARDPQDADIHNLLGFAYRKSGDLNRAFRHYHFAWHRIIAARTGTSARHISCVGILRAPRSTCARTGSVARAARSGTT